MNSNAVLTYTVRRLGRSTTRNVPAQRAILKLAQLIGSPEFIGALGLVLVNPAESQKILSEIAGILDQIDAEKAKGES